MNLKAYVWDDEDYGESYLVWATTPGKAKALLASEHDREFTEMRVSRVPWADKFGFGLKYPVISVEKFLKWAAKDITDDLPPAEWEEYKRCKSGK